MTEQANILMQKVIQNSDEIHHLCDQQGFTNPRIFGSVANGEADSDSDIDILVNFKSQEALPGYFAQNKLIACLERLFQCKTDVVVEEELKEYVLKSIKNRNIVWI